MQKLGEKLIRLASPTASNASIVILGGVHGNERVGIRVIERLMRDIPSTCRTVRCPPSVVLGLGNPRAVELGLRATDPTRDLNRMFQLNAGRGAEETPEGERSRLLRPVLAQASLLIDLHATNRPSRPFVRIAGPLTPDHRRFAGYFRPACETLLHDPEYLLAGQVVTTDEYVGAHGGTGICVETGHADDLGPEQSIYEGLVKLLTDLGALDEDEKKREEKEDEVPWRERFTIVERLVLPPQEPRGNGVPSGFQWHPSRELVNFEPCHADEPLALSCGSDTVLLRAPAKGVVVFPKAPQSKFWVPGAPIGWLAVPHSC